MPNPTNSPDNYYRDDEEDDLVEHDWCPFGSNDNIPEKAFDEDEDVSQDLSCDLEALLLISLIIHARYILLLTH